MLHRERVDLVSMLESGDLIKICAPMVRYSKLPFREVVRRYGTDVAFTPMIVSESFLKSSKARDIEFTTSPTDTPLVAQFAANNASDFAGVVQMIAPFVDAVDLNCGCPQDWVMQEGYGAKLLNNPQLIFDIVRQSKAVTNLPVSVKIRINSDIRKTLELVRQAESAGVSWITVHGRTTRQRSSTPPDLEAIKTIKEHATVPIVANGDIFTLQDAENMKNFTKANGKNLQKAKPINMLIPLKLGVMSARGLLENPALFAGYETTPIECVQDFVDYSLTLGTTLAIFHHHVGTMIEKFIHAQDKKIFWSLNGIPAILHFLEDRLGVYLPNSKTCN